MAYGSYEGGLRELIHLLKYNGVRPAAKVLGGLLAEALDAAELRRAGASMVWVATVAPTLKMASNYGQFRLDTEDDPAEEDEEGLARAAGN